MSPGKITPEETKHLYLQPWQTERYMLEMSESNKRIKKRFPPQWYTQTTGRPYILQGVPLGKRTEARAHLSPHLQSDQGPDPYLLHILGVWDKTLCVPSPQKNLIRRVGSYKWF